MQLDQLVSLSVSLLSNIALLIIISLGLAVIFGMMGVINLAHGEFLMLGAYLTLTAVRVGVNVWVAMLLAAFGVGAVGLLVERLLIRRLYGRMPATMLATWGLSLILTQVMVLIYGPASRGIPTPLGSVRVGEYSISEYSLALIIAAVAMLALTYLVLTRTRYGTMARAAATLPQMASAVGVDVRRTNMLTFGFGAMLSGAGGALLAPMTAVVPSMGQAYVGRAFMTVVVGGPGVLSGTVSASGLLGGVNSVLSNLTTSVLGTAALLVVAIVLLRFLPTGISGRRGRRT
ncbi:branched-chain amino acid ABC transporter permease [Dactylosporangium darangshiense]|uniref:Urea ABC transporter permease subunit UrtB n=1 Tax=Dactylosporangium darangshiense TaxID=579108 RepID=A0ABP8DTT1_9ACTN